MPGIATERGAGARPPPGMPPAGSALVVNFPVTRNPPRIP